MSETRGRCRQQLEAWFANNISSVPLYSWMIADAIDRLAADVEAVKAKVDAVSPEDVRHFVESEKAWVALITEQRDAAIRERDQWREEARLAVINRDEARAEVERLRAELAARPAANSSPEPRGWLTEEEKSRLGAIAVIVTKLGYITDAEIIRAIRARAGSPPVGWLMDDERDVLEDLAFRIERWVNVDKYDADRKRLAALRSILARAGSPPEQTAALWLTDKERAVVEDIASMIQQWFKMAWSDTDEKRCAVLRSILSRAGSPPVVVLPTVFKLSSLGDKLVALQQVKDAMDAAGVAWKEVWRE